LDLFDQIKPVIRQQKSRLIAGVGSLDNNLTDGGVKQIASILHGLLPFPIKLAVKKDTLVNLLLSNREQLRTLLQN
jgi:hypothetical protein